MLYVSYSPFITISLNFTFISYFSFANTASGNNTTANTTNKLPILIPFTFFFATINPIPTSAIINSTK